MTDTLALVESSFGSPGPEMVRAACASGLRAILLTRDPSGYGFSVKNPAPFDAIVVLDTSEPSVVIEHLRREPHVVGVLSPTDYSVECAAQVASALGLPGSAPSAVTMARNKLSTRRRCAECGVAVPWFGYVRSRSEALRAAERAGWPCVVKPLTEAGGVGVRLCRAPDEVLDAYAAVAGSPTDYRGRVKPAGALVEEYLVGLEVSVEMLDLGERRVTIGVTDKALGGHPRFVEIGQTFPSALPAYVTDGAARLAAGALDAIGYHFGAAHVEVKLTERGPVLIEINARMGGQEIARLIWEASSFDLPSAIDDLHAGRGSGLLDPRPHRGAASRFLFSPASGHLRAVLGESEAARVPGVVEVAVDAHSGAVRAAQDNTDVLGHVTAVGATSVEAERRATTALAQLQACIDVTIG
ncbi:MAG: ATP-grasp domain-containing protein [Solirubrobacteraceae bacterium]